MNGVLIINKPPGWTSHDVVNKARSILREKKIGHTGTLDPLATGVLVLCAGKATKIVRYLEADDKEYTAELLLGTTTDTQDAEGRVLETRQYQPPAPDEVQQALLSFQGPILQRPPAFSALKVSGVPSYRLARKGVMQQHEARPVTIHGIELLDYQDPLIRFRVHCSKGTYIRTLCTDIGERLGSGAHLTSLIRTRSGRFHLEQAVTLEQLAASMAPDGAGAPMIELHDALPDLPAITLEGPEARRVMHGNAVPLPSTEHAKGEDILVRVYDPEGGFIALAKVRTGMIRPEVVLA